MLNVTRTPGPLALVVFTLALGPAPASSAEKAASKAKTPAAPAPLAVVAGEPITVAEFEEFAGPRLFALRSQEYTQKRGLLEEAIDTRLLEKEGKARGISADELIRVEVEAKVPAVTEAEQKEFYEKNKARFGTRPEAEALKQIEAGLRQERMRERRVAFVKDLRDKAGVRILLDPPRAAVGAGDDDPSKGPANAPITIVEFSDFQCPYCARVNPTLKQVQERYGDKLRMVFRDYPLLQIHKDAAKAAEAGQCAQDQGKFWEMHDKLFENQAKLQVEALKQSAAEIGLDAASFNECLDSGKHAAEWRKDMEEGERYGVTGTPAFFINGRLLAGAQPLEAFTAVIDEELARVQTAAVPGSTK
jgi:protein-disulfide isomerase